jgi:hypothetical protein
VTQVTGPGTGGDGGVDATEGIRSLLRRRCGIDLRAAAWPDGLPPWHDAFRRGPRTEVAPWPDAFRRTAPSADGPSAPDPPVEHPSADDPSAPDPPLPVRRPGATGPADRPTGRVRPWSEAFTRTRGPDEP